MMTYLEMLKSVNNFKETPNPVQTVMDAFGIAPPVHKPRFTMLIGIPGCGKSTYASTQYAHVCSTDAKLEKIAKEKYGIVNDYNEAFKVMSANKEKWVEETIKDALTEIQHGRPVIYDATNLTHKRKTIIERARQAGAYIDLTIIMRDFETCIKVRSTKEKYISREIITNMANSFVAPDKEDYDEIKFVII